MPNKTKSTPVKPHDAAGLILTRDGRRGTEVLLGRRHPKSRFMPSVYVFPGGRLEPQDKRPSGFQESLVSQPSGVDRSTTTYFKALARAALRETFEEIGCLVLSETELDSSLSGTEPPASPAAVWQRYRALGRDPAFPALRLVARAITPAISPIRFHTRFFWIDEPEIATAGTGDGELEDIGWVRKSELPDLPMSEVTHLVLEEALHHKSQRPARRPAALFAWCGPREYARYRQAPPPIGA